MWESFGIKFFHLQWKNLSRDVLTGFHCIYLFTLVQRSDIQVTFSLSLFADENKARTHTEL